MGCDSFFGVGTSDAPEAILEASSQIDYFRSDKKEAWQTKVAMAEIPEVWQLKFLINQLKLSGKKIVRVDLVEVGSEDWDANFFARVLWEIVHLIS